VVPPLLVEEDVEAVEQQMLSLRMTAVGGRRLHAHQLAVRRAVDPVS
jgi:hypothetical protein